MSLIIEKRLGDGSLGHFMGGDVLHIADRIQFGDGPLGWAGDPTLELAWDHDHHQWVVLHRDREGRIYIAVTHPTCDEQLIRKLVAADNARTNPWETVRKQNEQHEVAAAKAFDEELSALSEKARWAIRRDIGWDTTGHHVGYTGATNG